MTYDEIIAEVVGVIDRSDFTTARATGVVQRARHMIQRAHKWTAQTQSGEGLSAELAFTGRRAELPENCKQALSLKLGRQHGGHWHETVLYPTSKENLDNWARVRGAVDSVHAVPVVAGSQAWPWGEAHNVFAVDGTSVVVAHRLPDDALAILDYVATLEMPNTDSDWWSVHVPDAVIYCAVVLALIEVAQMDDAGPGMEAYARLYESELAKAIQQDRESGPTATVYTPPPRGYGRHRRSCYGRH